MRIRTRLLLLSLAVVAPALIGSAIGIGYVYREQRTLHRENLARDGAAFASQLQRLFSDLPAEWHATIIDREGVIVAHSRETGRFVGSRVRPELLAQLRQRPEGFHPGRFPRVRVVIATGYSDRRVQLPGVRALAKPYDLRPAVAALNEALGR